jgi:hypothetical protein
MYLQKNTSVDHPRRRLSLLFTESSTKAQQPSPSLPRNELRRIVAEMVG